MDRKPTKNPNPVEHRQDGTSVLWINFNGESFECLIDTEDYELVREHRWRLNKCSHTEYAVTTAYKQGKRTRLNLSKLICPGCEVVCYKNYNGLDNRKSNLIPSTNSLKSIHKRKHQATQSRFKGVCRKSYKRVKTFMATIQSEDGGPTYLGSFASEIEAARRYNEAVKERFGESAYLNEIPEAQN
jgi:hypothetical protein